jgi:glycosyltransferase involved in cell wall biosynthesis
MIADCINVFSQFTKETLGKVFNNERITSKIMVSTIPVDYLRPVRINHTVGRINIAVIGLISYHKGGHILNEMARMIDTDSLYHGIRISVFGSLKAEYRHKNIIEKGEYKRENLPELMENNCIDIILIPSIWGETFSRTTQEAINMNIPVAVFNIGAPPERVSVYAKGIVIDDISAQAALDAITSYFVANKTQ